MLLEDIIPSNLSQASAEELKELRFEIAHRWSKAEKGVINAPDVLDKYEMILTELCSRGFRCHSLFKVDTVLSERKEYISKPYPNEHAARVHSPERYDYLRRTNDKFGNGIHVIFGIVGGKSEIQAIRFSTASFSVDEAKAWLKEHNINYVLFEPARETKETGGGLRGGPGGAMCTSCSWRGSCNDLVNGKCPECGGDVEMVGQQNPPNPKQDEEKRLENNDDNMYSNNVLVEIKVFKSNVAERLVSSIVYEPDVLDTDGEYTDEEVLRKAMIAFMKQKKNEFNVNHEGRDYTLPIIDNWQNRADFICEDGQVIKKGAWCMTVYVPYDNIWDSVVNGELTGFSLEGYAQVKEVE
jgi:hypothetical protein